MPEEKKDVERVPGVEVTGDEGKTPLGGKEDGGEENPGAGGQPGSEQGSSGKSGGNHSRKRGSKGKGSRGGHNGREGTGEEGKAETSYLTVGVKQFANQNSAITVTEKETASGLAIKGDQIARNEESIGRDVVTEASPTGLEISEKSVFRYVLKDLPGRLDNYNTPLVPGERDGVMRQISTMEELIAIPTIPVASESLPEYPNVCKVADGVITSTTKSDASYVAPIKPGFYVGQTMTIAYDDTKKKVAVKEIRLLDFTPAEVSDVSQNTIENTCSEAHYLGARESRVQNQKFTNFENQKNSGIAKNALYYAPESEKHIKLLMDIYRDTIENLFRAVSCANAYLVSINQNRKYSGVDVSKRFIPLLDQIRHVLDFKRDAKKFNVSADIATLGFSTDIVDSALNALEKYADKRVYARTSITLKEHYHDLLKWTKYSADHRSPAQRCVLAFSTIHPYSNVSYVDGVQVTNGLGGDVDRYYLAYEHGNNLKKVCYTSPIFDGIEDELSSRRFDKNDAFYKGNKMALTFDPEYPLFSFLVCRSMDKILVRLTQLMTDFSVYINEGGPLVNTFTKLDSIAKFTTYLSDAGYNSESRHMATSGRKVTVSKTANLRFRYPEVMSMVDETANGSDCLYVYHPGFINAYTLAVDKDGYREFEGSLSFPCGKTKLDPVKVVSQLDFMIAPNNASFRSTPLRITPATGGSTPQAWTDSSFKLQDMSINNWIKGRRIRGLINSIPTGLVPFDLNHHAYKATGLDKGFVADVNAASLLAKHINGTSIQGSTDKEEGSYELKTGMQLSSYRCRFYVPISKWAAAQFDVSNIDSSDAYLKECIINGFKAGNYKTEANATKYVTVNGDKYNTSLRPVHFTMFPFSPADLSIESAPYSSVHVWSQHADVMMMYSNPFIHIRATDAEGGDDANDLLVPHQVSTNEVFYWVTLDASEAFKASREAMDQNIDALEPGLY